MAAKKNVLVKPLLTEKAEILAEKDTPQYCFVVDKRANKIEIAKAIEEMYNVGVESVNTSILPSKVKTRNTRGGMTKGKKASIKKAYVRLAAGEEIDFFGEM